MIEANGKWDEEGALEAKVVPKMIFSSLRF